jgi:hypothetical protein
MNIYGANINTIFKNPSIKVLKCVIKFSLGRKTLRFFTSLRHLNIDLPLLFQYL